ncbi:MAG: HypC/HybG/HupF family hydrogenase formation chaperone [Gemmatimonadaceae bacterium]
MTAPIYDGAIVGATGGRQVAGPSCNDEFHCITCSDEGVPMRVEELLGTGLARCIDASDQRSDVMTGLVGDVAVGDVLLVHAGAAILQLPESEHGPGEERAA